MSTKTVLHPGQRDLRAVCDLLLPKLVRLRNKASLVRNEPVASRNLAALMHVAEEVHALLFELFDERCLVCGCTTAKPCIETTGGCCGWAKDWLCTKCADEGKVRP